MGYLEFAHQNFYKISWAEQKVVLYAEHVLKNNLRKLRLFPRTESELSLINISNRVLLECLLDVPLSKKYRSGEWVNALPQGFKTWKAWHTHLIELAEGQGFELIPCDPELY